MNDNDADGKRVRPSLIPTPSQLDTENNVVALRNNNSSENGVHDNDNNALEEDDPMWDDRPDLVRDALRRQRLGNLSPTDTLYYFGIGSNMLRSKVENRAVDGSTIEIISMRPAVVRGYRLAFSRAMPPMEPGMGSLERVRTGNDNDGDDINDNDSNNNDGPISRPVVAYEQPECHGALIEVTLDNYEKIMRSEGVGSTPRGGYQEVVVMAYPYDQPTQGVPAVALSMRKNTTNTKSLLSLSWLSLWPSLLVPSNRNKKANRQYTYDPTPSLRYMKILRQGAAELGLCEAYQTFLQNHPVEQVPFWLRWIAMSNLIFTFTLSSSWIDRSRRFSTMQRQLLFAVYVPQPPPLSESIQDRTRLLSFSYQKQLSLVTTGIILLPGAVLGALCHVAVYRCDLERMPLFMKRFIKASLQEMKSSSDSNSNSNSNSNSQ